MAPAHSLAEVQDLSSHLVDSHADVLRMHGDVRLYESKICTPGITYLLCITNRGPPHTLEPSTSLCFISKT